MSNSLGRKRQIVKRLLSGLLFLLMTGCGYRFAVQPSQDDQPSISVPYVEGDLDGQLTTALIREIAHSGKYRYVTEGGRYELRGKITLSEHDFIGFQYDRSPTTGKIRRRLRSR